MESLLENYIVENLDKLFPGMELVERNKILPGMRVADLILEDEDGKHVFVELRLRKLKRTDAGELVDHYQAIANLQPPLPSWRMVVVGGETDPEAKIILDRLEIEFRSLQELGISEESLKAILEKYEERCMRLLTPLEADLVSRWEGEGARIVDVDNVVRLLGSSRGYARVLIHRLESKGWLERIKQGVYLFIPAEYGYDDRYPPMDPLLVGSVLVKPYYYSYSTSNLYYGFTAQVRPLIYLATMKPRRNFGWRNNQYRFVTLTEYKFFGFQKRVVDGVEINIAEPEKSVVDSFDKPKYSGGIPETLCVLYSALRYKAFDHGKLVDYSIRMSSNSLAQRLGFLIDFLGEEELTFFPDEERGRLLRYVGKAPIYLAPTRIYGKGGSFSGEWRIVQNIDRGVLLSEIAIG